VFAVSFKAVLHPVYSGAHEFTGDPATGRRIDRMRNRGGADSPASCAHAYAPGQQRL